MPPTIHGVQAEKSLQEEAQVASGIRFRFPTCKGEAQHFCLAFALSHILTHCDPKLYMAGRGRHQLPSGDG